VLVVGPSGAGKDTLIDGARRHFAHDPVFVFPRRLITRTDAIGENHIAISWNGLADLKARGEVFVDWEAHGLAYAIHVAALGELKRGARVVVNVSRHIIEAVSARWPRVLVVHVTARADVLESRITSRGRESGDALRERVGRSRQIGLPAGTPFETVDNSGDVSVAEARFIAVLESVRPAEAITPASCEAAR